MSIITHTANISSTYCWMSPVVDDFNDVSTRCIKKVVTPLIKANGQTTVLIHSKKKAHYLLHILRTVVLTSSVQITRYTSNIFHHNKQYCFHHHLVLTNYTIFITQFTWCQIVIQLPSANYTQLEERHHYTCFFKLYGKLTIMKCDLGRSKSQCCHKNTCAQPKWLIWQHGRCNGSTVPY